MNENLKERSDNSDKLNETKHKFMTSTTVKILNDLKYDRTNWQHYELFRKYDQFLPNKMSSPINPPSTCSSVSSIERIHTPSTANNERIQQNIIEENLSTEIADQLQTLVEHHLPDLCSLDGEPMKFTPGTKFYCTIHDILTSDGEFWVEREFSPENERKFRQFVDILSIFATSYESVKDVYIGQLVALEYESSWHRALVVSKSDRFTESKQFSARVRLVDYGSSLYVNVSQLKWLPEQFYSFPFKTVQCVFSEAIKPTFSDTVRLTFKQIVLHKRLRATIYDRDGTRLCILLKCKTDEGIINLYRYLRAHEHKCKNGRILDDGDIVECLHKTIFHTNNTFDQSVVSSNSINNSMNLTLPILSPPSPIKLTRMEFESRQEEIKKICKEYENEFDRNSKEIHSHLSAHGIDMNKKISSPSSQGTPFSTCTIITPVPCLSFTQQ